MRNEKQKDVREAVSERERARRKLKEMNLLEDFLFMTLMSNPEYGEEFGKILLHIICRKKIDKLRVTAQKVYPGSDTDVHGIRLDVYMDGVTEEGGNQVTVYDIEPDQDSSTMSVAALPRRVRFYQAKIDSKNLKSGVDYSELKDVVIIMIMPYDPFGLNRMRYTIKSRCVEVPELPYEDGAQILFLYTKGEQGDIAEEVRELLHYMENTRGENAVSSELQYIHHMVDKIKQDEEVSLNYMKVYEREQMLLRQGAEQVMAQADERVKQAEEQRKQAEEQRKQAEERNLVNEMEIQRLRKEIELLKQNGK